MSLLADIQSACISDSSELAPILLKLRLLAARLGSTSLADWVKHESEGYPDDVAVPEYRKVSVSYKGTFSGPFNSGIKNAPIPPYLINEYCGENWTVFEMRQSIAGIDSLASKGTKEGSSLTVNAANLILLLQGKIYEGYACNEVIGTISSASLVDIQHAVRSRVLELTIELEQSIPAASNVEFGEVASDETSHEVSQISNQVIYGNVTTITSSGAHANISVGVAQGDLDSLERELTANGIDKADASALVEIVSGEQPESKEEPLGKKAGQWFVENLKKAADGTWKIGVAVATDVIKKAVSQYYGL
jgi:hypothetical protein